MEKMTPQNQFFSFYRLCELVSPYLSSMLLNKEGKTKVQEFSSLFSPALTAYLIGFECHLKENKGWVDCHFAPELDVSNLEELKRSFLHVGWEGSCEWKNIFSLCDNWAVNGPVCKFGKRNLFLEFDVGSSKVWPPKPNLFLMLNPDDEKFYELIDDSFYLLHLKRLSKDTIHYVRKCSTKDFGVAAVGFMLARSLGAVRLLAISRGCFSVPSLVNYLASLGHLGFEDDFITLLNKISPYLLKISLELDVSNHLLPKVGLNLRLSGNDPASLNKQWLVLLEILIAEGLIDNKVLLALSSWTGFQFDHEYSFQNQDSLGSQQQTQHIISRAISHIKLIHIPNKPLQAKIYLQAYSYTRNRL